MAIQSVQVQNPDGSTSRVQVGSKAYDRSLAAGGSIIDGTGTNIDTRDISQKAVNTTTPVQEVGVISSNQGLKELQKAQDSEIRLSPFQGMDKDGKLFDIDAKSSEEALKDPRLAEGSGVQKNPDYAVYADPDGREVRLEGDALTADKKQQLEGQGYTEVESSQSTEQENPELTALMEELEESNQELEDLREGLKSYMMSDSELQNELNTISMNFDAQQLKMQRINENRIKSLRTMGVRMGSRYTGGNQGGIMGGIIAEEQRQGVERIAELEAEKQARLAGAKRAAKEFNLSLYTKIIQEAEDAQAEKVSAVQDFLKIQQKASEELDEQYRQDQIQIGTLDLINQGITDPLAIMTQLRMQGVKVTPKEIKEYTNLISNTESLAGLSQDLRTYEFLKQSRPEELRAMGVNTYEGFLRAVGDAKRVSSGGSQDSQGGLDAPWGGRVSSDTLDIIDGIASFEDLTPTKKSQVRAELRAAGYYSDEIPDWFQSFIEESQQMNFMPSALQREWNNHRSPIIGFESENEDVAEGDIGALIAEFPRFEAQIRQAVQEGYSIEEIRDQIS